MHAQKIYCKGSIKKDKDTYVKSVFEFDMDAPSGGLNLMRWAGILLIVVGGGLAGKDLIKK